MAIRVGDYDLAVDIFHRRLVADLKRTNAAFDAHGGAIKEFALKVVLAFPTLAGGLLDPLLMKFGALGTGTVAGFGISLALEQTGLGRKGDNWPADCEYILDGLKQGVLARHPDTSIFTFEMKP